MREAFSFACGSAARAYLPTERIPLAYNRPHVHALSQPRAARDFHAPAPTASFSEFYVLMQIR